jgi:transcriptional regulator with XRE-family HTH domain
VSTPQRLATDDLGHRIREYRQRQRQLHSGAPWTQEDLAVAIDSDKSHINRIEKGHASPTKRTIERICDALALNWTERSQLLGYAGYLVDWPEPTTKDLDEVINAARPLLASSAYPLCLLDRRSRCWDLNALHAYWWLGFADPEAARERTRGMQTVEKLLDPRIDRWWQRVIVDFEGYARRALVRFEHLRRLHPYEPSTESLVTQIRQHELLGRIWNEITSNEIHNSPAFLDHQLVTVAHPDGMYKVWIWHASLTIDERFFLSHHVPADRQSQDLFEAWALRFSRSRRSLKVLGQR